MGAYPKVASSYMYMYDCKTKRTSDISKSFPEDVLRVGSSIDADDSTLMFLRPMQSNNGNLFFHKQYN